MAEEKKEVKKTIQPIVRAHEIHPGDKVPPVTKSKNAVTEGKPIKGEAVKPAKKDPPKK
jgi:hypothetical protein